MHCSIGVWDPVPLFRSGLCSALGASAAEVQPESLTEWARGDGAEVAVISIVVGDDWRLIPRLLCERKDLAVVALLEWSSQAGVRQALKLGATAALPRSVGISEVVGVVGSARARTSHGKNGVGIVQDGRQGRVVDRQVLQRIEGRPVPTDEQPAVIRRAVEVAVQAVVLDVDVDLDVDSEQPEHRLEEASHDRHRLAFGDRPPGRESVIITPKM